MVRSIIVGLFVLSCWSCDFGRSKSEVETGERTYLVPEIEPEMTGDYVHSVFIWLVDKENEEDKAAFESAMKKFIKDLPHAQSFHFGKVIPSEREVVDSSYDYSFIVSFNSELDMNRYETDPAHRTFLAETKSLIDHILIYDSRDLME